MAQLNEGWINHLRNVSRQDKDSKASNRHGLVTCRDCKADVPGDLPTFTEHYATKHDGSLSGKALEAELRKLSIQQTKTSPPALETSQAQPSSRKRPNPNPSSSDHQNEPSEMNEAERGNKKLCSPPPAPDRPTSRNAPQTQTPSRSRARPPDSEFDRGKMTPSRPLFDPQSGNPTTQPKNNSQPRSLQGKQPQQHRKQTTTPSQPPKPAATDYSELSELEINPDRPHTSIQPQPKTKPISQDQLVAEVKGIYAGLVMIEGKCIEVDNAQSRQKYNDLNSEQWTALVTLHRTLLHEHHDFFLASQHPSANIALRRLASKYAMPARMWRHGIHSFLEVLRHKLPHSYDHMLAFIYTAYSMMALLYETVPAFEDTWIECLGDLARYRMAIEDVDVKDRETWTGVARHWYSCASDKAPTTGRLYHHLAILARPNATQQLCYYTKSLCVSIPFPSARESIMTLFDPILNSTTSRLSQIDTAFVKSHAILFSGKNVDQLEASMEEYWGLLDPHIGRVAKRFLEIGYNIAIPLACSLIGYGSPTHFMVRLLSRRSGDAPATTAEDGPDEMFKYALAFNMKTFEIVVRRWGDLNTLPFIHTFLVFMYHVSLFPDAMVHLEQQFPWTLTAVMLNYLNHTCNFEVRMDSEAFPGALKNDSPRPLPEDFKMRGLIYAENLFPDNWYRDARVEEDEKQFELPSMTDQRKERILWLGRRLARSGKWLTWNESTRQFGVAEAFAASGEDISLETVLSVEKQHEQGLPEDSTP